MGSELAIKLGGQFAPCKEIVGSKHLAPRAIKWGAYINTSPQRRYKVKKVLRMLLLVVVCLGGIFLLIEAIAHPSSTLGYTLKIIFALTALICGTAPLYIQFSENPFAEKPDKDKSSILILLFIYFGFCLAAWIASYHVGTTAKYPVMVVERDDGKIEILDENGKFIFPFTGKIVGFPKEINLKMNIRIEKDDLREEWPVLVTLTMEEVGSIEKKAEFLKQHESHLSQWRSAIEEKVKEEICANNSKQLEEYLPQVVKKEKITIPLPSTGLRCGGYWVKEIKISRPKIFYLRQQ